MLEFQEKRKIKDWLQSKPVILVLIIFVALAARGKLGLAKPGESVTIITDVATSAPTTTPAESWWDRFVGFFQ